MRRTDEARTLQLSAGRSYFTRTIHQAVLYCTEMTQTNTRYAQAYYPSNPLPDTPGSVGGIQLINYCLKNERRNYYINEQI